MIIRSLAAIPPELQGFSPGSRKMESLFAASIRFVEVLQKFKSEGKDSLSSAIREEKRRSMKLALSLVSSQVLPEAVRPAFDSAAPSLTTADLSEIEMFIAGTKAALRGAHPVVVLRLMTSYLGLGAFEKTGAWLASQYKKGGSADQDLIIPGDLPEILLSYENRSGTLALAARLAGPPLVAAACAGCPRESVRAIAEAAYDDLGAAVLEDSMRAARSRLSSEELSDAQNAFITLLESLDEIPSGRRSSAIEDEREELVDPSLVADISSLIREMDEKLLKSVTSAIDPKIIASMIQGMEPLAHDRLFAIVPSGRGKKILDALEASSPLGTTEITRNAQLFAQRVLTEIAPRGKPRQKSLTLPAQVRAALSAILGRE